VVQVRVTDEGIEDTSKENTREESEDQIEEEEAPPESEEIPLENLKKAELLEKAKEVQKTADENYDLYMRSLAEIENLKKRYQKDKSDLIKYSNESLVKQLLIVIDNLEKAISAIQEENSVDALREGVELTLKGLMDTLGKTGLETVQAQGEPFDPNFHEAISELEDNTAEPGTVLQELQKGYILNDRLIRPAMVIVNKSSS